MFQVRLAAIGLLVAASMSADVTVRYKTAVRLNPTLPPQMTEQAMKSMGDFLPAEMVYQVKEGKGASSFGKMRAIADFTKQRITLIDPANKKLANTSAEQLVDEFTKTLADMPAEARAAVASMKATSESKMTGRTMTIQGIEAEEREVTMSVEGPSNLPAGPMFKLGIQFWTARAEEVQRVPALREMAEHNLSAYAIMNPSAMMEKMLQQIPGMGDGIAKVVKEMQTAKATLLKSEIKMYMPVIAAMMKQLAPEKNPFGDKFDAEAPFMEMTQELSELSTAPIPDSVFATPEGFTEVPVAEMVKAMIPKNPAGGK